MKNLRRDRYNFTDIVYKYHLYWNLCSQSGVAIEEISLEFEVIRLHTPKGKANILANLKNYQISYSEDSLVSMRMIRKVEDDSSIGTILSAFNELNLI